VLLRNVAGKGTPGAIPHPLICVNVAVAGHLKVPPGTTQEQAMNTVSMTAGTPTMPRAATEEPSQITPALTAFALFAASALAFIWLTGLPY
jgi:hypothetical protein